MAAREQECGNGLGRSEELLCSALRGQRGGRLAEVLLVLSWQHVPGSLRRAGWRQPGKNRSRRSLLLLSALPCSSALRSYPSVFNLCTNSPPAVPLAVSVPSPRQLWRGMLGGKRSFGLLMGGISRDAGSEMLQTQRSPVSLSSSGDPLAAEPARISHPIPSQ